MNDINVFRKMFFPMKNNIQNYSWGSKTSLHELFNVPNLNNEPQAELWMGAHRNGCSRVVVEENKEILLSEFINSSPTDILSQKVEKKFGELPFLFKILASDGALSIQVHPSKLEAEIGYKRENSLGVSLNAFERSYKDPNHKPELVYALTEYCAMNGFRSFDEIESFLRMIEHDFIQRITKEFSKNRSALGLERLFREILSLSGPELESAIAQLLKVSLVHQDVIAFSTLSDLSLQYPCDVGLFAPLMLNVITLEPGQAMYLDARTPHAYLHGTGLEVMANSNNVLRAGLTNKYIDIDELMKSTDFKHKSYDSILLEPTKSENMYDYVVPVDDFSFSIYVEAIDQIVGVNSAEILLPIDGELVMIHDSGEILKVKKGESVFVPAYAKNYKFTSLGRVARVYC